MTIVMNDGRRWRVNLELSRLENPLDPEDFFKCSDNTELFEIMKTHCFSLKEWFNFMQQLKSDTTIVKERR